MDSLTAFNKKDQRVKQSHFLLSLPYSVQLSFSLACFYRIVFYIPIFSPEFVFPQNRP